LTSGPPDKALFFPYTPNRVLLCCARHFY
jgi:hypothetical protein